MSNYKYFGIYYPSFEEAIYRYDTIFEKLEVFQNKTKIKHWEPSIYRYENRHSILPNAPFREIDEEEIALIVG